MIVTYLYKQSESIKNDLKTKQAQANDFNHWSRTNECYFSFLELFLELFFLEQRIQTSVSSFTKASSLQTEQTINLTVVLRSQIH